MMWVRWFVIILTQLIGRDRVVGEERRPPRGGVNLEHHNGVRNTSLVLAALTPAPNLSLSATRLSLG